MYNDRNKTKQPVTTNKSKEEGTGKKVKYLTLRLYMDRPQDNKLWDILCSLDKLGYKTMTRFLKDAILFHYQCKVEGRAVNSKEEMEVTLKQCLREVFAEQGYLTSTKKTSPKPQMETAPKEECTEDEEFDEVTMYQTFDFLNQL
jgi:hypothetical protein